MFESFKNHFDFKKQEALKVREFAHANKDVLIIVCYPKTDEMFVAYKDKFVTGRIKSATGKTMHVVKDVIHASRFHRSIDDFIVSIMETLNVPLKIGNQFYQFLDGALFNISRSLRRGAKASGPSGKLEAQPSPLVMGPDGRISKVESVSR